MKCADCCYFIGESVGQGRCRRYPPSTQWSSTATKNLVGPLGPPAGSQTMVRA